MFGWLAKMLMATPVGPSGCACCEGKRRQLEKMRRQITGEEELPAEKQQDSFPDDGCGWLSARPVDVDHISYGRKEE